MVKNTAKTYHTSFGVIEASNGAFRKGNVTAGISYFPNFDKVERLTSELVNAINQEMKKELSLIEKINLSFSVHFNLVSIHPFYDVNGRTSRLLMNYIQEVYNLPLAIVHNESKVEYINALVETRELNDIGIFHNFMMSEYTNLLNAEISKFETMNNKLPPTFNLLF